MRRSAGVLLAAVLGPGLLAACAPTTTAVTTRLAAEASLRGRLLTVTVLNAGPHDLLLEDDCPRPFSVGFTVLPVSSGVAGSSVGQPCVALALPPRLWRVGERVSSAMVVDLPAGTHTLQAWARPKVRLTSQGRPVGEVKVLNVVTSALTVTLP
ncbi:hypothetical protein Dcar01_03750 [Deinococcus carri]|uniref:Lipoprotein n=1 Tax=Deinococcus carri TaxID=1211323 RepID=A0ABP9WD66_9DEIO